MLSWIESNERSDALQAAKTKHKDHDYECTKNGDDKGMNSYVKI